MWIHSWNHTYARVVTHELGMSCLAKNNLSLSHLHSTDSTDDSPRVCLFAHSWPARVGAADRSRGVFISTFLPNSPDDSVSQSVATNEVPSMKTADEEIMGPTIKNKAKVACNFCFDSKAYGWQRIPRRN